MMYSLLVEDYDDLVDFVMELILVILLRLKLIIVIYKDEIMMLIIKLNGFDLVFVYCQYFSDQLW